jgi:hypothetical protein
VQVVRQIHLNPRHAPNVHTSNCACQ